jgi:hypothetical protein
MRFFNHIEIFNVISSKKSWNKKLKTEIKNGERGIQMSEDWGVFCLLIFKSSYTSRPV